MTTVDLREHMPHLRGQGFPARYSDGTLIERNLKPFYNPDPRYSEYVEEIREQQRNYAWEIQSQRFAGAGFIVHRWGYDFTHGKCSLANDWACTWPLPDDELVSIITPRGSAMVWRRCEQCEGMRSNYLSHKSLRKQGIDPYWDVPILEDRSRVEWEVCERCGCTDTPTELHHWAPHSLFDDPNDWPTSVLCVNCHREWHQTTRCALAHGGPS